MQEVELTSARLVRVWWAFAWRFAGLWVLFIAVSLLICSVSGLALVKLAGLSGHSAARMAAHALIATLLAGLPVAGVIAVRMALQNRSGGGFRLALLAIPESGDISPSA